MGPLRHECLVYSNSPARQLSAIAAVMRLRLEQGYRCMYFNSGQMIADLKVHLEDAGVDAHHELGATKLVLSSERPHLRHGWFDTRRMMQTLEDAFHETMSKGYAGLWATGDIAWEFGGEGDFSRLLEYESRLDAFFYAHPEFGGICQYHLPTLPSGAAGIGFYSHHSIFVSETLSLPNLNYLKPERLCD